ncbi:LEF-1 [Adoxophyes orana nucleopolyhedrovirus]|uniref:LEF-1 n=1 Tax=Adoxophyes orana nucleopolyhedrovirus TaxID=542343 RepID=UPI0001829C47|nr:LEF-1 [Adoxophyes orana nucleopolyhedrovirus]ACF05412.1 LEF-1 [Adoxophyes orana nucleopolyhedrovirus]
MLKRAEIYSPNRVLKMWNSMSFNDARKYAFLTSNKTWLHPARHFTSDEDLYEFLIKNRVQEVHAKALDENGGREWVIDVDFYDKDEILLLKIEVAKQIFINFFGENIKHIMFTGNRGLHVWLRVDRFMMSADTKLRTNYYGIFAKPTEEIDYNKIVRGSFIYAVKEAIKLDELKVWIDEHLKNYSLTQKILYLWPPVDAHIFCTLNQIRVPYSYHAIGRAYSKQLY